MGGRSASIRAPLVTGEVPADAYYVFRQLAQALDYLPPRPCLTDDVAVVAYSAARRAIQDGLTQCDQRLADLLGYGHSVEYLSGMEKEPKTDG